MNQMDVPTPHRIKQLRQARGWSQAKLSRVTGIHSSTLSHIENGHTKVWPNHLARLARAFDISLDELLRGAA